MLILCFAGTVWAQPETLPAKWKRDGESATYHLEWTGVNRYAKVVRSPAEKALRRVTLTHHHGGWTLRIEQLLRGTLGLTAVDGEGPRGRSWQEWRIVDLKRRGRKLTSPEWKITLPRDFELEYGDEEPEPDAPVVTDTRPLVKVLLTGFDKFPRPRNHPRWVYYDGTLREPELRINPSGWVVREFDVSDLSEELRRTVRVEIYKCNDVPVYYVGGAKVITDTIERIEPDVAISFGVGGTSADADVERECENIMDDHYESVEQFGRGPFQLPDNWPPQKPREHWTNEELRWAGRYPDNAGVSYNDHPIDTTAPETLESTLPVDEICRAIDRKQGLRSVDGAGGPGRYICNNVMFRVIQAQARIGRMGGFIHLPSWQESRRQKFIDVVSIAVEESVKAFLQRQAEASLPGAPVVPESGEEAPAEEAPAAEAPDDDGSLVDEESVAFGEPDDDLE